MLKKILKRLLPTQEQLQQHRFLRIFGAWIYERHLWDWDQQTVPKAVSIGLFCAFLPIPLQMLLAAALAIVLRAHIPLSVSLVWITNPITIPPIFYSCYKVGTLLLQLPPHHIQFELSFEWLMHSINAVWEPLLLGSVVCASVASILGFFIVKLIWRWKAHRKTA